MNDEIGNKNSSQRPNMTESFEEAELRFSNFLKNNGYPEKILWVQPEDVLLTGERKIFLRLPVPDSNKQKVQELYELSSIKGAAILFEAFFTLDESSCAFAWMPTTVEEAQYRLMGTDVKFSVVERRSMIPARTVTNKLRWKWLQWVLRGKQKDKNYLFS